MDDEIVDVGLPEIEDEQFEIQVTDDEPMSEAEKQLAELKTKLEEAEAAKQALEQQTVERSAEDPIAKLAALLEKNNTPAPPSNNQVQDFQAQYQKIIEDTRNNFHSDPTQSVINLVAPLLNQMEQKMEQTSSVTDKLTSKLSVVQGEDAGFYTKYKDEVEGLAAGIQGKDSYQKAVAQVKLMHMDEIVQEQVNKRLEEAIAASVGETPADIQRKAPFTLGNRQTAPAQAAQKQTIRISTAEERRGREFANSHMLSWDNPQHKAIIVKKIKSGEI